MANPNERPCFFIQFAGQGMKYFDELRHVYTTHPDIRPFVLNAIATIKEQATRYDDRETGFFEKGLAVDRWLDHPEETPDFAYLMSSPISHPLIYLTQIATYISLVQQGLDQELLLRHTHSATGFSTGIVATILCAMGLPLDALKKQAITVQAMFFWQGIRTQQSIYQYNVQPELGVEQTATPEGGPSCMASVNNLPVQDLGRALAMFPGEGPVYLAYRLLPDRSIISGLPDDLAEFRIFLKNRHYNAQWKNIPSTIAAHSPYLAYALEVTPMDARRIDIDLSGADLKIPVWSNDAGKDLRNSADLIADVMQAYFVRAGDWVKQVAPLTESNEITHVLDFGPGTGVASLTEKVIGGAHIPVIRCSVPLGRQILFDEILPALTAG